MIIFAPEIMIYSLMTSLPMVACALIALQTLLEAIFYPQLRQMRWLLVFFCVTTTLYACHWVYFNKGYAAPYLFDTVYCFCNPAVFPLYLIYIKTLTEKHIPRWHYMVLLAPAVVCCALVGTTYAAGGDIDAAHMVVKITFAIELVVVSTLGWRKINRFNNLVEQNFTTLEGKRLSWANIMLVLFVVISLASFVSNIIGREWFNGSTTLLTIPSVAFSMLLFTIGYIGLKQHFFIDDVIAELNGDDYMNYEDTDNVDNDNGSTSTNHHSQHVTDLQQRLVQIVEGEQLYLQPQLKLSDVVRRLGTNRAYLYQVINVDMNTSFSEYINRLRVEHAARIINSDHTMPLTDVAIHSGFASTPSFYRNFKQYKGMSPSEYRSSIG